MKPTARVQSVAYACFLFLLLNTPAFCQQPDQKSVVQLRVLVPQANAKLWIFNTQYLPTGDERKFISPSIGPGKFFYDLKVFWEPNNYTKITRRKRILVERGRTYVVDLREKNPKIPDDIKVRYVPTPQVVVEQMLKLGKVGRGDVVFDLGCGDGRFVVTAVSRFAAKRGVGVDIDPQRIIESRANAKRSGVSDKVVFREGDVLKKIDDLEQADVVMLYMGNDINLRLRPLLRKRLKPGSRVVSHRFHMGDWKPNRAITVKDNEGTSYRLLLWNITKKTKELEK